jgi:2-amino-4-hydroxy-6-hydroxymethyldihydropteridine diphosphokinase
MPWTKVAIGLGSNLGDPEAQLDLACQAMRSSTQVRQFKCSDYYHSKPLGPQDQPDFVNAVCVFETLLEPEKLLDWLQQIEQQQGRIKERHWGERLIDLDLLLYGEHSVTSLRLMVPHPYLAERDFVLLPLFEVWSDAVIPGKGALLSLIENLPNQYVITKGTV